MALAAGAVMLALVLLLAVPVAVAFRFQGIEAFNGQINIRWLFGLVRIGVRVPGTAARAKPEKRRRRANALVLLRQAPFRRRVYRLLRDVLAAVCVQRLRLHMRLGMGDPADTGRLWALLGPLNAAADNLRHAEVQIEPDFADSSLEFQFDGRLRVVPLQLVALATGFALSPASLRAWRTLIRGRA